MIWDCSKTNICNMMVTETWQICLGLLRGLGRQQQRNIHGFVSRLRVFPMNHTLHAQCQKSVFCPKVPFDEHRRFWCSEHIDALEIMILGTSRRCFGRRNEKYESQSMVVIIENPPTNPTACHQILTGGHSVELIIANHNHTFFFVSPHFCTGASQYRDRE